MHLQLSSSNTKSELLILEERLADNRQLASECLDAIIDVRKMSTLRSGFVGLNNQGYETSHRGPMVVGIVMRKMDFPPLRRVH